MVLAAATLIAGCSEAPAGCRAEVAASFERLRTSGRPYRKEFTATFGSQSFQQVTEYLPPDRLHEVTSNRMAEVEAHGLRLPAHEINSEVIRVGPRAWSKVKTTEWQEWEPGLAQEIFGAGMDFLLFPDRILPADAAFECLGVVVFKDNVYVGYRTKLDKSVSYVAPRDPKQRKELEAKLQQELQHMAQEWRTVFVDASSGLPVYDIVAAQNELDKPRSQVHYTYPGDMKIEPPVR